MLIPVESMQQKPLYVVNGGIKMPIGWRFLPTDEEVLVHYLQRKELGLQFPAGVIPEIDDIFNTEPWNLPGCLNENRYFFSRLKASDVMNSDKKRRFAGSGYWETNDGIDGVGISLGDISALSKGEQYWKRTKQYWKRTKLSDVATGAKEALKSPCLCSAFLTLTLILTVVFQWR